MPRLTAPCLALLCLFTLLLTHAPTRAADEPQPSPAATASEAEASLLQAGPDLPGRRQALAHESENSWALARETYAALLPTLSDPAQAAWCELWLLNARQNSTPRPQDWEQGNAWDRRQVATYEKLLRPYVEQGRARDEFWAAIQLQRHRFTRANPSQQDTQLLRRSVELLEYRSGASPSPAAARQWYQTLQELLAGHLEASSLYDESGALEANGINALFTRLLDQLAQAAACPLLSPEERAWCTLRHTLLLSSRSDLLTRHELWTDCVRQTAGTQAAALAEGLAFLNRLNELPSQARRRLQATLDSRISAASGLGDPTAPPAGNAVTGLPDLPSLLAELKRHRTAINGSPYQDECYHLDSSLEKIQGSWTTPELRASPNSEPLPGKPLSLVYGETGYTSLSVSLHRLRPDQYRKLMESHPRSSAALAFLLQDAPAQFARTLRLPPTGSLAWTTGTIELDASLAPGLYVVELSADAKDKPHFELWPLVCTDLRATLVTTHDRGSQLWLEEKSTGKPIANRQLRVLTTLKEDNWQGDTLPATHTDLEASTDQQGLALLPSLRLPSRGRYGLIIDVGLQPVFIVGWNFLPTSGEPRLTGDLFVERALFRPGETVHWRLFLRQRNAGAWQLPEGTFTARLMGYGDTVLCDFGRIKLDATGSWSSQYALAEDIKAGRLRLEVRRPPAEDKDTQENSDARVVTELCLVDRFQPPPVELTVNLASPAASLRPGGRLRVRAHASYLSGGPVADANATLTLDKRETHYHFGRQRTHAANTWPEDSNAFPSSRHTDSEGNADFLIDVPADLGGDWQLSASVELAAPVLPPVNTEVTWSLTPSGVSYRLDEGSPSYAAPGELLPIRATLVDGTGKPLALDATLRLLESRWEECWRSPDGSLVQERPEGFPLPEPNRQGRRSWKGWELVRAGDELTPVSTFQLHSGRDGRLEHGLRLPRPGRYLVQWFHGEKAIAPAAGIIPTNERPHEVFCVDEHTCDLPLPCDESRLLPGRAAEPGALQEALVILPDKRSSGLLCSNGERNSASLRLGAGRRVQLVRLPSPDDDQPSFHLSLHPLGWHPRHLYPQSLDVAIARPSRKPALQLSLSPGQASVRPGSQGSLGLQASSGEGLPASASIAVAITDDSLNALLPVRLDTEPLFNTATRHLGQTTARSDSENTLTWDGSMPYDPRALLGLVGWDDRESEEEELPGLELSTRAFESYGSIRGLRALYETDLVSREGIVMDEGDKSLQRSAVSLDEFALGGIPASAKPHRPSPEQTMFGPAGGAQPTPLIRRHFASSALWAAELRTDGSGKLSVPVKFPDNLTRWRARAYAVSLTGQAFATATTTIDASLPFQARLQAPRSLIEGDLVHVSSTLVNRGETALQATSTLHMQGPLTHSQPSGTRSLSVDASGESNAFWALRAGSKGVAQLTLEAKAGAESDAMQLSVPILEDGLRLPLSSGAVLASKETTRSFDLTLPEPLDPARTELRLVLTPSLAGAMLDALPYLIDYPYGCVEQTMSRFLPAVIVKEVLANQGIDALTLEQRILPRRPVQRAAKAGSSELDAVIKASLARLEEAQLQQGGFGWWPGAPTADLWMSSYVKWGLMLAHGAKVKSPGSMDARLTEYLIQNLSGKKDLEPDLKAWILAALALDDSRNDAKKAILAKAFSDLFGTRARLSLRGSACLALAAPLLGDTSQREVLQRNLRNGALLSHDTGLGELAQWGSGTGSWRADEGAVENTALTLMALLALDPQDPLAAPAAHWLALNRRGANWSNTRDTAFAVLALSRYVLLRGEASPSVKLALSINGASPTVLEIGPDALLAGPVSIPVIPSLLRPGRNSFMLTRLAGSSPVFASAVASAWSRGEGLPASGSLLALGRTFAESRSTTTLAGPSHPVEFPLAQAAIARRGNQVFADLALRSPHDLEYLMIVIPKPAGCEPLNPLSGYDVELTPLEKGDFERLSKGELLAASAADIRNPDSTHRDSTPPSVPRLLYREEYDDRSVIFIDHLEAGDWRLRLRLSAVFPGDYRALPATIEAMYVPEIRAHTDSTRVRIGD